MCREKLFKLSEPTDGPCYLSNTVIGPSKLSQTSKVCVVYFHQISRWHIGPFFHFFFFFLNVMVELRICQAGQQAGRLKHFGKVPVQVFRKVKGRGWTRSSLVTMGCSSTALMSACSCWLPPGTSSTLGRSWGLHDGKTRTTGSCTACRAALHNTHTHNKEIRHWKHTQHKVIWLNHSWLLFSTLFYSLFFIWSYTPTIRNLRNYGDS